MIIMIAAQDKNGVIANKNGIPWQGDMPRDVAFFRATTSGSTVVMGGNVYDEFDAPLVDRKNLVLTRRNAKSLRNGFAKIDSISEIIKLADDQKVFIIGGATLYEQCMPYADQVVLTTIDAEFDGTVYFPKLESDQWQKTSSDFFESDSENKYDMTIDSYRSKRD